MKATEEEDRTIRHEKLQVEINKLLAETFLLNKKTNWYSIVAVATVTATFTVAIMTVSRMFP